MKKDQTGHHFLARLGKTRLRPGGRFATEWLINQTRFAPDTQVLEVACNMGTTAVGLAQRFGCHITGVDLDENALNKARQNIRAAGLESLVQVQHANATELPFPHNSFDVVINEAMLTMLIGEDKERALKEYSRVLRPGGVLLTHDVVFREEDPKVQHELMAGLSKAINVHVEPLTLAGWKETIEKHAFRTEQKHGDMTLLDPPGILHDEGAKE